MQQHVGSALWRVQELGARMTRGGAPVALLTEADHLEERGLAPGETRELVLPPPGEARPPLRLRVRLRARAIRGETLEALGLGARGGEVPELEIGEVER